METVCSPIEDNERKENQLVDDHGQGGRES